MGSPSLRRWKVWACASLVAAVLAVGCDAEPGEPAGDDAGAGLDAGGPEPRTDGGPGRDAGTRPDAAPADAGTGQDGGDAAADDDGGAVTADAGSPETLADTGLYAAGSLTTLAPGVLAYTPRYALWSDGADKQRYIYLPPGASIDTSDMDHWQFPDGTKAWKQFTQGTQRIETRLLEKRAGQWRMVAFAWNAAQTQAVAAPDGVQNALGTEHDIPASGLCLDCHAPLPGRLAGFGAIQLSHAGPGVTLAALIADGKLSAPPAGDFALPDTAEWNALGYLHANCGQCHNPHGEAFDKADGMQLWLTTAALGDVASTVSYTTTVSVSTSINFGGFSQRIVPGAKAMSALYERLQMARGADGAMPPLATEQVDSTAVTMIGQWIDSL